MRQALLLAVCLTACGCVQRQMHITSEPAGALVYMNDEEVGRTPLTRDFLWYGNYDVQVRKPGFETLDTNAQVTAPWWQWPPFDLFAELMPFRPTDRRDLHFALQPTDETEVDPQAMIERAGVMRDQLQSPRTDKH